MFLWLFVKYKGFVLVYLVYSYFIVVGNLRDRWMEKEIDK